jgi:hypothetical protein
LSRSKFHLKGERSIGKLLSEDPNCTPFHFLPYRGQKTLKAATDVHAEGETMLKQSYTGMQSLEKAMAELDHPGHMPEGLDEHVWQRLVQARRMKVESEQKVGGIFV